jgi:hypothetical protein
MKPMADTVFSSVVLSNLLLNNPANKEEYTCGRCRDHETQLKEALNELSSAQTIISILQNELILAKTSTTTCIVNRSHTDEPNSEPDAEVWKLAAYNNNIIKAQKRAKSIRNEHASSSYSVLTCKSVLSTF